ncbi:MAG: DUF309 domain-containing protein [Thermoprotei archaeon]
MPSNKRLLILVKNDNFSPSDRKVLIDNLRQEFSNFFRINDLRIASKHVEIDIICDDIMKAKKIEKFNPILLIRDLSSYDEVTDVFQKARELFNSERFWEFHELLEEVWRKKNGDEKRLLHGLILIAASLVHMQRNNTLVSIRIMRRALDELKPFDISYNGIDISSVKSKITLMLQENKIQLFKI